MRGGVRLVRVHEGGVVASVHKGGRSMHTLAHDGGRLNFCNFDAHVLIE